MQAARKVIFFSASWCEPCKSYKTIVPDLCDELGIVLQVSDVDINASLCLDYNVESLPTLLFLDEEGNEIGRIVGASPQETLREKAHSLLGYITQEEERMRLGLMEEEKGT